MPNFSPILITPPPGTLPAPADVAVPRYTSYPTADRFNEAYTAEDYRLAVLQRSTGGVAGACAPLGIYVHLPFCESICYFCACNKIVTRDHDITPVYLDALEREMALVAGLMSEPARISHLHLGGGTPTYLTDAELSGLMDRLRRHFRFLPDAEHAMEVDPRTVTRARLRHLRDLGFQRLSFGVQDFDPQVQQAVHREQSFQHMEALMDESRVLGFASVNIDLMYGLPRQTPQGFERTLQQVAALAPDRIALYAYAHLPARFKAQRRIVSSELPAPPQCVEMLGMAIDRLGDCGYEHIGMDHFALPGDSLALAKRQGRLHRNFQGYTTVPDTDLVGLGLSAIGRIGPNYVQNAKTLEEYSEMLLRGELPVVRGLSLTRDDLLRRAVIMAIMCHGWVSFESIEVAYLINFRRHFAHEIEQLQALADDGWVTLHDDSICLTPMGWFFVRQVAQVFDRYSQADRARERYSRVI